MKKNNTAEKTIQDAKKISNALKESYKDTLKGVLNEAINSMITEEDNKDEDPDKGDHEDDYDVEDVNTNPEDGEEGHDNPDTPDGGDENTDGEGDGEEGHDEGDAEGDDFWNSMKDNMIGNDSYDLTGEDGETALNAIKNLSDDDHVFVKPDDAEGEGDVNDDAADGEGENPEGADGEGEGEDATLDINLDDNGEGEEAEEPSEGDDDETIDIDLDGKDGASDEPDADENGDGDENPDEGEPDADNEEGDDNEKPIDEEKQEITNDYQKKDPLEGSKMNEPANPSTTYSMDGGAPKGTERPYGKKGDGDPYKENVNENDEEECDLQEDGSGLNTKHAMKKSTNHINKDAQNQHVSSENGEVKALRESLRKMVDKAKLIQEENKKYKECVNEIKKSLTEAAVTNVALSQIVKLLAENTTTSDEKKSIIKRFGNVTTITESKNLYATIKQELSETKRPKIVLEQQLSAEPKQALNETQIYHNENDPSLDLMRRMEKLYK